MEHDLRAMSKTHFAPFALTARDTMDDEPLAEGEL